VPMTDDLTAVVGDRDLLIAGMRPEHFADATLVEEHKRSRGVTFRAHVDVTEWLGSEQYAFIPYEAPEDIAARLAELARELDSEQLRTQLVVSLDPISQIRDGEPADLWVDPARMHLFDPRTGENLSRREQPAGSIPMTGTRQNATSRHLSK
jgi:multiple sugar transport system ATP-binding protein